MKYSKDNPLRVGTLFSGYDSQMLAFLDVEKKHPEFSAKCVFWCEIDKYACKAHDLLFPEYAGLNIGDISTVDWDSVPDADLVTWSFPCQSLSAAGHRKGMVEGSGTTSSLCYEALKCFDAKRPKYLVMENVPALLWKENEDSWNDVLRKLDQMGYANFYQIVDASRFDCPQKRERVFMFSILRTKDDPFPSYAFPVGTPTEKCVYDIMEDEVPDNVWLNQDKVDEKLSKIPREELLSYLRFP